MRSRHFYLLLLMLTAVAAPDIFAATPHKEIWDWTLDERLAKRFDPADVRARNRTEIEAHGEGARASATTGSGRDRHQVPVMEYTIDGKRNPELFLPHELFDALLSGLSPDASVQARQRTYYQRSIRSLEYDDAEFWPALESVSAGYLVAKTRGCTDPDCITTLCSARFQALQNARRLFGKQQFERLLYTVVAPAMDVSTATLDPNYPESLRKAETGCR